MCKTSLQSAFTVLLFLSLFLGCKEGNDIFDNLSLRSNQNENFYWENNKIAAQRLASIMYNKTDSNMNERFKIVHVSDPHLSEHSLSNNYKNPFNLKQSIHFSNQQELRINALVATGDFVSNGEKKDVIQYLKSFTTSLSAENNIPTFFCTGNHDSNIIESIPNSFIPKNELNSLLFSSYKFKPLNTSKNYYFSDVPNPQGGKIRFIALDMLDQPSNEYNTMKYASFSQEQVDWLGNVALKQGMTNQHSIVILEHYPFQRYEPNATTYLCDGDFVHSWNMVPEIIEAYRSRTSLTKSYKNKLSADKDIFVDFDFNNYKGEFICYLGGHAHCTAYFKIKGLENENKDLIPQKMILCTNQAPSETGIVYNRVTRQEDSLSSNSFCIYAIDTKEKKVYITFFGAYKPSDKPDYPEIHSISYQ